MNDSLPTAIAVTKRPFPSLIWLIPIAAVVTSVVIAVYAWRERGQTVRIHFAHGDGLRPGDDIRYRGVTIGQVEKLILTDDASGVVVHATLVRQAGSFARAGARFWVVRPHVGLSGVSGLETVIGPRYLAAEPGDGVVIREHAGLAQMPAPRPESGSRILRITASTVSGLRIGSPVTFRQIAVGRVSGIRLANDATAIDIELIIDPPNVDLVRSKSVFWNASGIDIAAGLVTGLKVEIDSLQSVMAGGIAFATPNTPGETVSNGHRFPLLDEAPEDARSWQPAIAIGAALLPAGQWAVWPQPVRLSWHHGRWLKGLQTREGWALPTAKGWLLPADLVRMPEDAVEGSVHLIVGGMDVEMPKEVSGEALVAHLPGESPQGERLPTLRAWAAPEDVLLYGDPAYGPRPVSAEQQSSDGVLLNDPGAPWHGSIVRSRADGTMLGFLVRLGEQARIISQPSAPR